MNRRQLLKSFLAATAAPIALKIEPVIAKLETVAEPTLETVQKIVLPKKSPIAHDIFTIEDVASVAVENRIDMIEYSMVTKSTSTFSWHGRGPQVVSIDFYNTQSALVLENVCKGDDEITCRINHLTGSYILTGHVSKFAASIKTKFRAFGDTEITITNVPAAIRPNEIRVYTIEMMLTESVIFIENTI